MRLLNGLERHSAKCDEIGMRNTLTGELKFCRHAEGIMPETRGLFEVARERIRTQHLSYRTEQAYLSWIRRYVNFHDRKHPREMGGVEVENFLTHLAVQCRVTASTQNQALQALLFLYRQVLNVDLPWLDNVTRASRPKRLPVVLTIGEVRSVLAQLDGTPWLVASLLYGSGLRLTEGLKLRVKDLVVERGELIVRGGKGDKDRVTVLPGSIIGPLRMHLAKLHVRFEQQRKAGEPGVSLPAAFAHKSPNAALQWGWQYVFPAGVLCSDPYTGRPTRHHIHERVIQRAVQQAVRKAGITQPASCHTFRHCFATHLLEAGCDIRTVQELLGHSDVRATMIYTHVLGKRAMGVKSPLDRVESKTIC
jgi:integron integrase